MLPLCRPLGWARCVLRCVVVLMLMMKVTGRARSPGSGVGCLSWNMSACGLIVVMLSVAGGVCLVTMLVVLVTGLSRPVQGVSAVGLSVWWKEVIMRLVASVLLLD